MHLTRKSHMSYCLYYKAHIKRADCWFFVAILRSFEHLAFDRTLDTQESVFEFFVPQATEKYFLEMMAYFQEQGIVTDLVQVPNRFMLDNDGV